MIKPASTFSTITVFAVLALQPSSADQPASAFAAPITRILAAADASTRVLDITAHLSDRIGPRLAGSPQADEAVRWTAERMRADGLTDVRLQPVPVPRWIRGEEHAEILHPGRQRLPVTALGGSAGTPAEGLEAEVVAVSSFDELAALGDRVRGKIVYYHTPLDPSRHPIDAYGEAIPYRSRGAIEAARHGAVASLIRSLATASIGSPHTGAMTYAADVPRIPHGALSTEAGDLLHRLTAAGETPRIRLTLTCRSDPPGESANVIAHLRGRERPEELVVISAHLDSWDLGSGAIDAANSVAIAMETPRLLAELGLVPRRTIRVVLFMNEEMGASGAATYARMADSEVEAHVAALQSDSGNGAPLGFRVSRGPGVEGTLAGPAGSEGDLAPALQAVRRWARLLDPIGATWVDYGGIRGSASDLAPLGLRNVLVLALRNDQTRYLDIHHTDGDTFDKVDPHLLRRNLAAMAAMTWALAESRERF